MHYRLSDIFHQYLVRLSIWPIFLGIYLGYCWHHSLISNHFNSSIRKINVLINNFIILLALLNHSSELFVDFLVHLFSILNSVIYLFCLIILIILTWPAIFRIYPVNCCSITYRISFISFQFCFVICYAYLGIYLDYYWNLLLNI